MMYWVFKAILKPLLLLIYGIRVEGLENVPRKGGAIIAANHVSFLDSFFIPLVIRWRRVTYLAKADYFKSKKTAWFFRSAGQIPCEREGGKKSQQSLEIALDVLAAGNLLGIYPEGTRSPDGRLHRGRTGVARLTIAAGTVVIPCGLVGTDEVMPKNRKFPRLFNRGRRIGVIVRFGKPLDFSRYAGQERDRFVLRSITDEIVYEIMQLSGQEYVDEYASRTATLPMPESTRSADDIDLSDEALVG
ncbi:MAG TPA: lysophospholipid acyltransferase family protein [Actinomycetota bacterium]|nr:lysophospholipid acyltransferase family protein [Actinomycetota bacterium]